MTISPSFRDHAGALVSGLTAAGIYTLLAYALLDGPLRSHWLEIAFVGVFFSFFTYRRLRKARDKTLHARSAPPPQ